MLVSAAAIVAIFVLRMAAEPIIGADISFTAFFPIVILAVLSGGAVGGLAAIGAGSLVALVFSASAVEAGARPDAISRLILWIVSSVAVASVALALRRAMSALKARSADLEDAVRRQELVVGELEHRGRNALSIVQTLSHETASQCADVTQYERSLAAKMKALAASYAFLTRTLPTPILLGSLVAESLTVFRSRIEIEGGPPVWIQPEASIAFALVMHELATNAAKYGALSVRDGRVIVGWTVEEARSLRLTWAEKNGPRPIGRSYPGSGSRLIQRAFARLPGGSVEVDYRPSGLVCTLASRFGREGPALPEPKEGARPPTMEGFRESLRSHSPPAVDARRRRSF